MTWDDVTNSANIDILDVFSAQIVYVVDLDRHESIGALTTPANHQSMKSNRPDDYDLDGVDARRSHYELEVFTDNLPAGIREGHKVEAYGKVFTIARFDPPEGNTTIIHLLDTGEVV